MNILKKVLYNITRPYVKKYLTNNLGKVVEDDEKLTCYVKKSKIKKKKYDYTIACFGIGDAQKKIATVFNLNKTICYVIDSVDLKKHSARIFGYNNCEVIIKDCNFGLNLHVLVIGKCTIDNTNINALGYLSIVANDLIIKNMDSDQIRSIYSESNINFYANNKIDVINSIIDSQKKNINVSFLTANELNFVNSKIVGKKIKCKSKIINTDEKSSLIASNKVNLQTNDFDFININAPTIVLNGKETSNEKKSVVLQKTTEQLTLKRLELVNLLKKVKTQCESINTEKILEYEEQINVQPVSKIKKK